MKNIPVNPADILAYKIDREDVKRFAANYAKWLGMYLVVLFMYVMTTRTVKDTSFLSLLNLYFVFVTLLFLGCFFYYGRVIYKVRTRYRKDIEKYGAQVLTKDLINPDNEVFYLDRNKFETYVVLSDSFFYNSHTRIFSWDEISGVYMNPAETHYLNSLDLNSSNNGGIKPYNPNSKNPKEIVRFIKHALIVLKNGKKVKCVVALEEAQLKELLRILNDRLLRSSHSDFAAEQEIIE